jgi:hypothetical protein
MTAGCGADSFHRVGDHAINLKEAYELVGGESGLAQDRAENAALYVGASVVRDDYAYGGTTGMLQHVMAAGHMVDEKAGTL